MRTTIRLPDDLLRRAKRKAAADGRTLTALIEDGLRSVLADTPHSKPKKRVMPRISRAKGGLMPGIDPTKMWELDEADDLDRIRPLAKQK